MESISKSAQTPQNSHSIPGQSESREDNSPNTFWPKLAHHLLLEKVFLTKMSTPTTHRIASEVYPTKKSTPLRKINPPFPQMLSRFYGTETCRKSCQPIRFKDGQSI